MIFKLFNEQYNIVYAIVNKSCTYALLRNGIKTFNKKFWSMTKLYFYVRQPIKLFLIHKQRPEVHCV